MTPFDGQAASDAHKNDPQTATPEARPPLRRCRRVTEAAFVGAVADWLDGGPWACEDAAYNPYHGYHIRLRERGDHLVMLRSKKETVAEAAPVVCRETKTTLRGPDGNGATMHSEARTLCDVAVRGNAGMYRS